MDYSFFLEADYPEASSCVRHQVHELTELHDKFGGFPDSYCFENTKIHQRWFDCDEVDFDELGSELKMDVITLSAIRQPPGCVVPWHWDTFYLLRQKYPDRDDPVRMLVFLEDWRLGHFVQHDDHVVTHWKQGDQILLRPKNLHLSANAGMQPKYTLQVSGFLSA